MLLKYKEITEYKKITGAFKLFDFIVKNAHKLTDIVVENESGSYFDFVLWVSEHQVDQSEFYLNLNDQNFALKSDFIAYFDKEKSKPYTIDFLMLQSGKILVNDSEGFYWLFDNSEQVPLEKEVKFD